MTSTFADLSNVFSWIKIYELRLQFHWTLKSVPRGPIDNFPALFQIMVWCQLGNKPLSSTMMISLLTQICVTRPQWVNIATKALRLFAGNIKSFHRTLMETHLPWTKWPPFRIRHFQTHFLEWKRLNFDWNFTEIIAKDSISNKQALV